jgi:hypothetical protein
MSDPMLAHPGSTASAGIIHVIGVMDLGWLGEGMDFDS